MQHSSTSTINKSLQTKQHLVLLVQVLKLLHCERRSDSWHCILEGLEGLDLQLNDASYKRSFEARAFHHQIWSDHMHLALIFVALTM